MRHHRSHLQVFFDWAKINKLALFNPVCIQIQQPSPAILHYPFEVIKQLSSYIVDPQTDPTEALTLYLIIFHGFTSWELCHTKISNLQGLRDDILMPTLAERYHLIVPKQPVSRGKRAPGRPKIGLDFPPVAASWLKPLLERFEYQRQQRLRNPSNEYLITAPGQTRHAKAVSSAFILRVVQRASQRAIKAICTPKLLRITAAVMYTDQAGAGVLNWMGWGILQAFFYSWGPREVIHPQPIDSFLSEDMEINIEFTDFPSSREGSLVQASFHDLKG